MCRPARRSILLYIPYVVKFGQTARAHYANIQEVRNSGAGCFTSRWFLVLVRRVMNRNLRVVIMCTAALTSHYVIIIIIIYFAVGTRPSPRFDSRSRSRRLSLTRCLRVIRVHGTVPAAADRR